MPEVAAGVVEENNGAAVGTPLVAAVQGATPVAAVGGGQSPAAQEPTGDVGTDRRSTRKRTVHTVPWKFREDKEENG